MAKVGHMPRLKLLGRLGREHLAHLVSVVEAGLFLMSKYLTHRKGFQRLGDQHK